MWLALLISISFLFLITTASASITIRSGSCLAGEVCLFSLWNISNSHTGVCGYYTNYSVCSDEVSSAVINSSCLNGENSLLSFYQPNNTHVAKVGIYDYLLCVSPSNYTCALRSNCLSYQTCMGSLYNYTNSHFGECGYYSNQICCGTDSIPPQISNYSINVTKILPGAGVKFVVNVTDDFEVSTVLATIEYPNGTMVNFTMSKLSGDLYHLEINDTYSNGIHYWRKTYANDTSNNWNVTYPGLKFIVLGLTYKIEGIAQNFNTGEIIQSGTAIAIIKETGDRNTGNIDNGRYSIDLWTYLNSSKTKFTVGIVLNSSEGVTGWNSIIVGNGPFAPKTQKCSTRKWRFGGLAMDLITGNLIEKGTVTVRVSTEIESFSNSSSFVNGEWEVFIYPCLISGELYTFKITITSGGRSSVYFINQVAF